MIDSFENPFRSFVSLAC